MDNSTLFADLSHFQGAPDWRAMRAGGRRVAWLKATESTSYPFASWFRTEQPQAAAAGLTTGAYHFATAADGAAQARYFLSVVPPAVRLLAVDCERSGLGAVALAQAAQDHRIGLPRDVVSAVDARAGGPAPAWGLLADVNVALDAAAPPDVAAAVRSLAASRVVAIIAGFAAEVKRQRGASQPVVLYGRSFMIDLGIRDRMGCDWLWAPRYNGSTLSRANLGDTAGFGWPAERVAAWQFTNGQVGPMPHVCPGVGACDNSLLFVPIAKLQPASAPPVVKFDRHAVVLVEGEPVADFGMPAPAARAVRRALAELRKRWRSVMRTGDPAQVTIRITRRPR